MCEQWSSGAQAEASARLGESERVVVLVDDGHRGDSRASVEDLESPLDRVDWLGREERVLVGRQQRDRRPLLVLAVEVVDALALLVEQLCVDPLADFLRTLRLVRDAERDLGVERRLDAARTARAAGCSRPSSSWSNRRCRPFGT